MEVWIIEEKEGGVYGWNKKPLAPFPLPEGGNLIDFLLQHWKQNWETHHYVVFSDEEKKEIERLGAPFGRPLADRTLRVMVLELLSVARPGYAVITYEPADKPDFTLNSGQHLHLCIEFNRPIR